MLAARPELTCLEGQALIRELGIPVWLPNSLLPRQLPEDFVCESGFFYFGVDHYRPVRYDPEQPARLERTRLQNERREQRRNREARRRERTRLLNKADLSWAIHAVQHFLNSRYPLPNWDRLAHRSLPYSCYNLVSLLQLLRDVSGRQSLFKVVPELKDLRRQLYKPGSLRALQQAVQVLYHYPGYQKEVKPHLRKLQQLYFLLPPARYQVDPLAKSRQRYLQSQAKVRRRDKPAGRRQPLKPHRQPVS